jgi:hypothetical protein
MYAAGAARHSSAQCTPPATSEGGAHLRSAHMPRTRPRRCRQPPPPSFRVFCLLYALLLLHRPTCHMPHVTFTCHTQPQEARSQATSIHSEHMSPHTIPHVYPIHPMHMSQHTAHMQEAQTNDSS